MKRENGTVLVEFYTVLVKVIFKNLYVNRDTAVNINPPDTIFSLIIIYY